MCHVESTILIISFNGESALRRIAGFLLTVRLPDGLSSPDLLAVLLPDLDLHRARPTSAVVRRWESCCDCNRLSLTFLTRKGLEHFSDTEVLDEVDGWRGGEGGHKRMSMETMTLD